MSSQHPDKDERLDPETILDRYNLRSSDENTSASADSAYRQQKKKGRLRVYLGAAAGVGKTYAMLNEGHRRKERGTDVVIGYVETHKRPFTQAQIEDLENVPRKHISYRGVTLEEMDTEAIIARHPQVALVDELAHTNVTGSKHAKRYQDVNELLNAGIDVVTTLNVQHLESLNDLITSITGVRVRETLPDTILDQADEVELIDIAPHALRQRMKHGNIYPAERIDAALNNFFREGNLTALRELALRRTADKTETQLQQYMTENHIDQPWNTTERVLVGFDHRTHSRRVLRDAWRLAHGLHADLIAISIQPVGYAGFVRKAIGFFKYGIHAAEQREQAKKRVDEHALFAEDLGAEVVLISSSDIARTMVEFAHERQITQIVVGQPARSPLEELLRRSTINRLLRLSSDIDIHLVPVNRKGREKM